MLNLEKLSTEARNPASSRIDKLDTLSMMRVMNDEDQKTALAVKAILPDIARAVDVIAPRLKTGGRLFYMGSGTSGRLGILDAVECPPTYSTDPDLVQGLIAGGKEAIFRAREGAEDSLDKGADDIISHDLSAKDVLVGITASGRTPYVLHCRSYAHLPSRSGSRDGVDAHEGRDRNEDDPQHALDGHHDPSWQSAGQPHD